MVASDARVLRQEVFRTKGTKTKLETEKESFQMMGNGRSCTQTDGSEGGRGRRRSEEHGGWMDGVSTWGMDDWLPSEPVKPEERVPEGWGGGEQSGAGLISKPAKEESVVSFFTEMCFLPARVRFLLLHFFPRLARTFLFFFFFAFV